MQKLFSEHTRLWIATGLGLLTYFVLPGHWSTISRVLIAWNGGVASFMVMLYVWMTRLTAQQICTRFIEEDESAPVVLVIVITAALLSLVAIVAILSTVRNFTGTARLLHIALAGVTVADSWLVVPMIFTVQYADMFYSATAEDRPLLFPRTTMPVFWDFAYFSFTIAAACQTSDVSTTGQSIRKLVIAQTLISFLFNASILGFAINVSAGLFGA
jgi:uncharacterized membrane protein